MSTPVVVGVDVGGTKVLAGVVDAEGRPGRLVRRSTPGRRVDVAVVEKTLVAAVREAADGAPVAAVGVAAAGFVDATGERVLFAPHLPWRGEPVRSRLSRALGVPVTLENDASCAAVAESIHGTARGAGSMVMVTLGTGIGGGLVHEGRLWRGTNGMAGEFGHMQVVAGGLPCECGLSGCWEQYCSGKALLRFARARIGQGPTVLSELCDGIPENLTGPMVTEAAETGDLAARQAFAEVGSWLGLGLGNLVAALDPALLVVGGGVSAAGDWLLEPARTGLVASLVAASERTRDGEPVRRVPPLRAAELGPEAGMIGAAVLARAAAGGPA